MSDSFEFTLHSPLTKEDWNKLLDAEFENTISITYQTPQGRQVKYIKCEVLDKIRDEIEGLKPCQGCFYDGITRCLEIIDKHIAESEEKE